MEHPFDTLTRRLGEQQSRRTLLKRAGAGALGVLAASLVPKGLRGRRLQPAQPEW